MAVDRPARRPRYTIVQVSDPHVPAGHDDVALLRAHLLGREPERSPLDEIVLVRGLRLIGMDSSVPGEVHGELDDGQLEALADELTEPAADARVLVVHHWPIWSTTPMSELVALREPERLAAVIRGSDVRLILSSHTHRVSAGTLAGVPVWVSPATGSHADVLARNGFRGHTGGGFTRIDILDDGELVAPFVPLTGRDEILYEVRAEESQLRPAI
jgi:3',5'-cyclic-AMP phosphodiesterase